MLRILLGWALNWLVLLALIQAFLLYACQFASLGLEDVPLLHRELLFGWLWSIGQKVLFNDPLVIITSRGLPMLLRSKMCACLCSEGCIEYIGQAVEAMGAIAKEVMA